jgi:hypothetical protein
MNHKGRDVLISELYAEAMSKKIVKEDWSTFIKAKIKGI